MAESPKTYTIRGTIRTNMIGSECEFEFEIDADDWDGMTDDEKDEAAKESAFSYIEWDYEVVDSNEEYDA